MNPIYQDALQLQIYSQTIRRDLHRYPELGFKEVRTAGIIAQELGRLGLEVTTGVAETGVVAIVEGEHPGPVALLRFDMDALPIEEDTGVEYASQNPGIMHACGHDGHVAVGLTVARLLANRRDAIKGAVKLVFQPAEEGMGGAERMIEAGVLDMPRPEVTFALHLWNERPVGWIGVPPGPLMAGAEVLTVKITGRGGHGALPHQTIDPVVAMAQMITGLQSIVSRNLSPLESGVISACRVRAGEAFNVIPQTAEFQGTIRTFEPNVRQKVIERVKAMIDATAQAYTCCAETLIERLTPAVINMPNAAAVVQKAALDVIPDVEIDPTYRTMVSEDMAFMMEQVPGCFFMVGSANPDRGLAYGHHHPKFDFDETVLPRASAIMAAAALEYLK